MDSEIRKKRKIEERKRKRRWRKKVFNTVKLVMVSIVLVCFVRFLVTQTGLLHHAGGLVNEENVPAGYMERSDVSLQAPVARTGSQLKEQMKKLAKKDSGYRKIYENYDAYPEQLLSALCSNPEMLSYVQGYLDARPLASGGFTGKEKRQQLPLLIQWDKRWGYVPYGNSRIGMSGCAPTCLSMVLLALTGNTKATPDQVAEYAENAGYYQEGTGTSWSLMTEGCEHFGIHGTEISLDENVIKQHLEKGEPIICSMRPGDFTTEGHFIVLAGEADGKIMVNDPNSRKRSRVLWDYDTLEPQIKNLWAFSK